jgi:hypothetical protein
MRLRMLIKFGLRASASALLMFGLLAWPSAHAWEATTRLTNVPVVGLARRLSGGQHLQQHANVSAALLRPTGEPRESRREAVIQTLSELIATFSKVMEDNADRVR